MRSTMRAALLTEYGQIDNVSAPIPDWGDDEVLVQVMSVGICGSDVAVYNGNHPYKKPPIILGHELCGIVKQIGKNIRDFSVGDKVCSSSFSHCEQCTNCLIGQPHLCQNKLPLSNADFQGAFAEYVILKQNMTHRVSDQVKFSVGALIEPLAIGLHAVKLTSVLAPKKIAILGTGSIGLSCLITAKMIGLKNIVMTDVSSYKGTIAQKLGANNFVNASKENPIKSTIEKLGGQADVTIIASGHANVFDEALNITKHGGNIIIVSYFPHNKIEVDLNTCVRREISIQGSALCTPEDLKQVIEWVEKGQIDPSPMISHFMPLNDTAKAMRFKVQEPTDVIKIMLHTQNHPEEA